MPQQQLSPSTGIIEVSHHIQPLWYTLFLFSAILPAKMERLCCLWVQGERRCNCKSCTAIVIIKVHLEIQQILPRVFWGFVQQLFCSKLVVKKKFLITCPQSIALMFYSALFQSLQLLHKDKQIY